MNEQEMYSRGIRIPTSSRSSFFDSINYEGSDLVLEGDLSIVQGSTALIVFAHGSGSGMQSTRNQFLAKHLNKSGFSTLLFDLLLEAEKNVESQNSSSPKFDIKLLSTRLKEATEWIINEPDTKNMDIGYYSSSTGSAAAILACRALPQVRVVVSRSGRIDLVNGQELSNIAIPVLLILGSYDTHVLNLTLERAKHLSNCKIIIIKDASHLFEEPTKMEEVVTYSLAWLRYYLLRSGDISEIVSKSDEIKNITPRNIVTRRIFFGLRNKLSLQIKFQDRKAAAQALAKVLHRRVNKLRKEYNSRLCILAIPRGGVIIGDILAEELSAEFDIVISKKLRSPVNPENAIGAVLPDGSMHLDTSINSTFLTREYIEEEARQQREEIRRRSSLYRGNKKEYQINHNVVVLVDDGIASGSTVIAAARWVRSQNPCSLIIAAPIINKEIIDVLKREADEVDYVFCPSSFRTVEQYYNKFEQLNDDQVLEISKKHKLC